VGDAAERRINFYFDYISHNAYLAWHRLPRIVAESGYTLRCVPVLFAGFLKAYGQLGPAEVAPKLAWMNRSNLRKAALLGIPLNAPKQHPFHPLFTLRLTSQPMSEDDRARVTGTLLQAVWVESIDPNDRSAIAGRLSDEGLDGDALVAGADSPEAKAQLQANGEEAIALGAFGVPTMTVGDEMFWGYDDLDYLELILKRGDPLEQLDVSAYTAAWERARAAGQHR
jgi:2-hydroxychromene-2-carboxylate isomerase